MWIADIATKTSINLCDFWLPSTNLWPEWPSEPLRPLQMIVGLHDTVYIQISLLPSLPHVTLPLSTGSPQVWGVHPECNRHQEWSHEGVCTCIRGVGWLTVSPGMKYMIKQWSAALDGIIVYKCVHISCRNLRQIMRQSWSWMQTLMHTCVATSLPTMVPTPFVTSWIWREANTWIRVSYVLHSACISHKEETWKVTLLARYYIGWIMACLTALLHTKCFSYSTYWFLDHAQPPAEHLNVTVPWITKQIP